MLTADIQTSYNVTSIKFKVMRTGSASLEAVIVLQVRLHVGDLVGAQIVHATCGDDTQVNV